MLDVRLVRQLVSFGAVGLVATATHVAIAWTAAAVFGMHFLLANLLAAIAAFWISFRGNARMTFGTDRPVRESAPRYLVIAAMSYVFASAIMAFVQSHGLPGYIYAVSVLCVVPLGSFLLAKLWAFAPANP